jgi:hypothetical protein
MPNKRLAKKFENQLNQELVFEQYGKDHKVAYHPSFDCWYHISPGGKHTRIKGDYITFYFPHNLEDLISNLGNGVDKVKISPKPKIFNIQKVIWLENFQSLSFNQSKALNQYLRQLIQSKYSNLEDSTRKKYSLKDLEKKIIGF